MLHGLHFFELDVFATVACGHADAEGLERRLREVFPDVASYSMPTRGVGPDVPCGTTVQAT